MACAALKLAETNCFRGIDINMGCPAQKVVSSGSGSALMKDLSLAGKIIAEVRSAVPYTKLSVKMRLGWDDGHINAAELAHIAEDCGADLLTVHGRTRMQQYSGHADWTAVAKVRTKVHIPVLVNGDITDGDSALRALKITGCDGVAIGRGALGNPFVFQEIRAVINGRSYVPPSDEMIVQTAIRQAEMMREWKGEHAAVLEMRKHLCWYIHGKRGAAKLRTRITTADSLQNVYDLLHEFAALNAQQTVDNCLRQ